MDLVVIPIGILVLGIPLCLAIKKVGWRRKRILIIKK